MVARARNPETERYPPDGIVWADTLKTLERPARGDKKAYTTYYVRIPKSIVQKFGIMIDDEVSVKIGDTNRANSWEEYYHVSRLGDGLAVILSKMARQGSETLARIGKGEHIMIEMRAHPYSGRRELGVCAPALWAVCAVLG